MYIELRDGEVKDTIEVGKNIFLDVDENGDALGIELLFVRCKFGKEDLASKASKA